MIEALMIESAGLKRVDIINKTLSYDFIFIHNRANEARAKQAENLSALEQDITRLEKAAALSIARMITYPR